MAEPPPTRSAAQKAAQKRYAATPKGRAARARYLAKFYASLAARLEAELARDAERHSPGV